MAANDLRPPVCLSIAGSDSGGGAGIQADLKAFARCGVHGTSAITALTAQNTLAVESIFPVEPGFLEAQVRVVVDDIGVDAIKVGMLGDAATIAAVARALEACAGPPVVVDPVMVAESGAPLLEPQAEGALVEQILPLASVITPNLAEARRLAGASEGALEAEALAASIRMLGPGAVLVTGGHAEDGNDVLVDGSGAVTRIGGPRHPSGAAHGSGCTHSSALAAFLAHGLELVEAARWARVIAAEAVEQGLSSLGGGAGPVDVLGLGRIRAGALGPLPPLAFAPLA